MGCDIHLFAEVKPRRTLLHRIVFFWKKTKWKNIDRWTKNKYFEPGNGEPFLEIESENRFYTGGRSYNLFSALCGVRSECFNDPVSISEPRGLPDDVSQEVLEESQSYGSDGHSHNWNTLKELKEFDWSSYGNTTDRFLNEVIPKMESQGVKDDEVRIVYFFDN